VLATIGEDLHLRAEGVDDFVAPTIDKKACRLLEAHIRLCSRNDALARSPWFVIALWTAIIKYPSTGKGVATNI
jgi:hypothetical protein